MRPHEPAAAPFIAPLTCSLGEAARRLWRAPVWLRCSIVVVFLAGLVARVVLALAVEPILASDARDYHVLAQNLAEGRGYVQVYEGETDAYRGFTFRAYRPPGFPALLALAYSLFGWTPGVYLTLNILADVVTQLSYLLLAAAILGAGPALAVQLLLALHVLWTPNPMTESVYTALFGLLALGVVTRLPLRRVAGAVVFGLLAAAALFVRPITLCVFPVLVWQCWRHVRSARGVGLLLLALVPSVIGVAAWNVRNYRLFDRYVFFTTNFGHHNAYDFGIPADLAFARLRERGLNEAEINAALTQAIRQTVRERPLASAVIFMTRSAELFSLKPPWEVENVLWGPLFGPPGARGWTFALYRLSFHQYPVTYFLAACGAAVLLLRWRSTGGLVLLLAAYVVLHGLVSRGDLRLVAPVYPILAVLAAALLLAGRARSPAKHDRISDVQGEPP